MAVAMRFGGNSGTAQSITYISGGGGGGGATSLQLLWENSDPTATFAAQTITIDLSTYGAVFIKTLNDRTSLTPQYHTELVFVGDSSVCYSSNASTTSYTYKRQADATTSGITFGNGYRNTTAGSGYAIPVKVYGIGTGVAPVPEDPLNTFSGTIVQFIASKAKPIVEIDGEITAQQGGSGTPSPSNIRPITGFTEANIYQEIAYNQSATPKQTISFGNVVPSTYQQVEFLESSGTQYIDSNIECTSDLAVHFKAKCSSATNAALCGGINTANNPVYFRHHWSPYGTTFYWIQNNNSNTSAVTNNGSETIDYTVQIDPASGVAVVNDVQKTFTALANNLTTGKSYGIFARIADTGAIQRRAGRIYYFRFYRNSQLIGNFIPCVRKADSVAGMYDTVTNQFFTNSGTGTFTTGDPVNVVYGGSYHIASDGTVTLTVTHGNIASYNGETLPSTWISDRDEYAVGTTPTTGAQVVYKLASPTTTTLSSISPLNTLVGTNEMWTDTGDITVTAYGTPLS